MALQIRRGPNAQRATTLLQTGEVVWTTDTKKLYVGDGVTTGGVNILANIAGTGFVWNPSTEQLDLAGSTITGINADNVAETIGVVPRLWYRSSLGKTHASEIFTTVAGAAHSGISFSWDDVNQKLTATVTGENAQDAAAALFTAGTHSGISFNYGLTQDAANRIDATVSSEYIQDTVNDLVTAGVHTGITFTYSDSLNALSASVDSEYIQDQAVALFTAGTHTGITFTYNDNLNALSSAVTFPTRGGNLDSNLVLNNYNITGTGNINITGNIAAGTGAVSGASVTALQLNGKTILLTPDITDGTSGISIVTTATDNDNYDLFSIAAFHNGGAANYGNSSQYIRGRGTVSTPSAVQTGDFIHNLAFNVVTSASTSVKNAEITVEVDTGTINATQAPAKISFKTMTNAGSLATALTIDSGSVIGFASTQQLVAGAGSGQVNVGGGVVAYVRLKVGNTTYAMPLYNINP